MKYIVEITEIMSESNIEKLFQDQITNELVKVVQIQLGTENFTIHVESGTKKGELKKKKHS